MMHKTKMHKTKIHKKYKTNTRTKKRVIGGNIFLDSIGSTIIHKEEKPNYKSLAVPGSRYLKLINPNTYSISNSSTNTVRDLLSITYNYRTPNQININTIPKETILSSSKVEREPYIVIDNIMRYFLVMYESKPYNKIYWLIECNIHSKKNTFLSYLSPNPKDSLVHTFIIQLYKYPSTIPPFVLSIKATIKRKTAFREFFEYINTYKLGQPTPAATKVLSIKAEADGNVNIFDILSKPKSGDSKTIQKFTKS